MLLPSDVFGDHIVTNQIDLSCDLNIMGSNNSVRKLKIDPGAFRTSRNFTQVVKIIYCNIGELDFQFLADFKKMDSLILYSIVDIDRAHWNTFPPLFSLKDLLINQIKSIELNEWKTFPSLVKGLANISLESCRISDVAMERILQWLIDSPTGNTLEQLNIQRNWLTKIPNQISLFRGLTRIFLGLQPLMKKTVIRPEMINVCNHNILHLGLASIDINYLEPGLFQGFKNKKQKYLF